ncbi:MAG TPA: type II toxin-antitoxin system HicB family antitoxin [Polyangia bacterium]|jgi:predicted RNase H-like HicB family nuclease
MSKPNYRVNLSFDVERKVFVARAPELEHCSAEGATRAEAIGRLEEEIDAQLANMLSHGTTPPRSVDEEVFSGELSVKVSKLLHRDLVFQARSEGIELDHILGEMLAAAMETRKQSHRGRGGNRVQSEPNQFGNDNIGNRHDGGPRRSGGFGRGSNPQLLDDRATFIEYVRGLEQGNNPNHGHSRGGMSHGGHGGMSGGAGPGGGAGNDRRRRRGGRGGNGGPGNFRPNGQGQGAGPGQHERNANHQSWNGNGAPRSDGAQAVASPAAAPAPSAPRDPQGDGSGNV